MGGPGSNFVMVLIAGGLVAWIMRGLMKHSGLSGTDPIARHPIRRGARHCARRRRGNRARVSGFGRKRLVAGISFRTLRRRGCYRVEALRRARSDFVKSQTGEPSQTG